MNDQWRNFLQGAGAHIEGHEVVDFGAPDEELNAAASGTILCDLSHFALIRASGADAETFLQGQLTNDVRLVTEERSELAAYCSPKGRALAVMRLFRRGDDYYLALPRELLEPTLKRLRMFILRSRVALEQADGQLLGIAGPGAEKQVAELVRGLVGGLVGGVPGQADDVMTAGAQTVIRLPGSTIRYVLYTPTGEAPALWERLAASARPVGSGPWLWQEIRAGLPWVHSETTESFVPQMLNLQMINGISFRKGCYTGQEIVARTQYLGTLKRRMYLAHVDEEDAPPPGTPLFSPSSESGQGAGKVVAAARAPGGGCDLLAVVQSSLVADAELFLRDANGPQLTIEPLPYAFDEGN